MNENSQKQTCSRCGVTVAPGALQGLCPRCLMALNLGTQTDLEGNDAGPHGTRVVKAPPLPAPAPEEVAKLFPQFEVLEFLGRGGMGAVYKARQPKLDRFVALKILLPERKAEGQFAERFAREARALARLNHPSIVAVYDFGEAGGYAYLVMEYVDGLSLRQLLRQGQMAPEAALEIVPKICAALQFAHQQGIVHRDIKPENILLDKQGQVKIADFGIAKVLVPGAQDLSLTGGKDVVGTPHYMAPEQIERPAKVDHRADIFSLGVVFYEMLTGELPLGKFQPPSRKVHVDVRLDEVVLHALEKEPERRYQHASEVKSAVETIAGAPMSARGGEGGQTSSAAAGSRGPESEPALVTSVRRQVRGPAIGLLVTGILNWVTIPVFVMLLASGILRSAEDTGFPQGAVLALALGFLGLCCFIIYAALKAMHLQARGAGVAASVLAMLVTPGNIIGLPLGIWALLVLNRREVREAFGAANLRTGAPPSGTGPDAAPPEASGTPVQASKKRKGEFIGIGAGVQAVGLACFFLPPFGWIFGVVLLLIGGRLALKLICTHCGNRVTRDAIICPACDAHFDQPEDASRMAAQPRWVTPARWTARILGTLCILLVLPFILAEGLPPIAGQPEGVQLSFAAGLLLFLGFLLGWWREGRAAVLIAAGWLLYNISENSVRWTPFHGVLAIAALYAACWWATRGRKTGLVLAAAGGLALALGLGRLFSPTSVFVGGTVIDALTGQPIAQAELTVPRLTPARSHQDKGPDARTNPDGRYRLYVGWYDAQVRVRIAAAGYVTATERLGPRALGRRQVQRDFQLQPTNAAAARFFGPVIERVVRHNLPGPQPDSMIDFDSGRLITPPTPRAADWEWVVANGVDAIGDTGANVRGLLATGGTVVVPVARDAWDKFTLLDLRQIVMPLSSTLQTGVAMPGTGELPASFAFKTRAGGLGLLQILGLTDDGHGVKIRYKLVQTESGATGQTANRQAGAAPDLALVVTLFNEIEDFALAIGA